MRKKKLFLPGAVFFFWHRKPMLMLHQELSSLHPFPLQSILHFSPNIIFAHHPSPEGSPGPHSDEVESNG